MGKVVTGGTMSLDGYIAGPGDSGFDLLFRWYGNGDVELPSASPSVPPPRISAASAELVGREWADTGALVVGRRLYDLTGAWGGRHPMDVTTVVLTHRRPDDRPEDDADFVFVTEGIEAAVATARELAGDRDVAVNGGQMARQCLEAGLLDEIGVELVPVVLGGGTPLFADLSSAPVTFEGPFTTVHGDGVLHLRYRVTAPPDPQPAAVAAPSAAQEYREVAGRFTALVEGVRDAATWENPSPVPEWTARDVVRHLVVWFPPFVADGAGVVLPAGPDVDDDPVAAWRVLSDGVQAVLDDPGSAGTTLVNRHVGEMTLGDAVSRFFTTDVFMHSWDLARATGQDETLDARRCAEILDGLEPIDELLRASGQFGPKVDVPADADAQTRMLAFIGRDPAPARPA